MNRKLLFIGLSLIVLNSGCSKDKEDPLTEPTIVKEWTIPLSAAYESPAPAGRTETGTATLQLLSDNSLKYTISVTGLANGDQLQAAHLHAGDVITSGPVVLGLEPSFSGGTASGTISAIRSSLADSLKNNANEIYINVHSTQVGGGLVRGQLNNSIDMAADVALSGANEVPAVNTTATGKALLRLTTDKKLYAKVTVESLEAGDALSMAHIHSGAAGVNGNVLVGLYGSAADFGTVKIIPVEEAVFQSLKNDALYVNAHSTNHPAGIVRGQIR